MNRTLYSLLITLIIIFNMCLKPAKADDVFEFSWKYYKQKFISEEGRVVDYQKNNITTSEGQSYALLRALTMNDKAAFDKVYVWTKNNLLNQQYGLFSWLWGNNNGNWQILDNNSASDADIDIAFALIIASKKWHNETYLADAKNLINNIWQNETIDVNGIRVLAAGINQVQSEDVLVNPSYFATYAFKAFARIDKAHNWQELVNSSYNLIDQVTAKTSTGLPPDWFSINKTTGEISLIENKSDFSYDAVRTFLRFYIDYSITNDYRAKNFLSKADFFINNWKKDKKLYTNYKSTGELKDAYEAIGSIASLLPAIKTINKEVAQDIYKNKIESYYKEAGYWNDPLDYYAQNLVWFGVWIYLNDTNSFKLLEKTIKN